MSKNSAIEIILRVRPVKEPFKDFKINKEQNRAEFKIQKIKQQGYINNKIEDRSFQFNQIFDENAKQQKIFDKVAKDVIDSALDGYNGTIFAYGQTGSGKTFTMTGGAASFEEKGLIPRTLSYIFNECMRKNQRNINVIVKYMQIYKSIGYDLLSQDNVGRKQLEDLPKVQPRQNANGDLVLQNLSSFNPKTEEDAMNLLFIGDTNRVVCSTSKNDESTRSHCIFIIILETSKPGSDIKTVATINLVDLSGSERINETTELEGKSQKERQTIKKEAISINLGLHYLQRVIVELNRKAKGQNVHIPYRQSLMTMVLRDSIGGNCKTRMIATMSPKECDIMESISTCKFAMSVALIKNDLSKNENVDPAIIIARLKKQNLQLKAELALLKGQQVKEQLDKYDIEDCHKLVQDYIADEDPSAGIILTDRLKINECFYHFKSLLKMGGGALTQKKFVSNQSKKLEKSLLHPTNESDQRSADQIKRLKLLVQQRDNQIALLVTLINKKKNNVEPTVLPVKRDIQQQNLLKSIVKEKPLTFPKEEQMMKKELLQKNLDQNETKNESISSKENSLFNRNKSIVPPQNQLDAQQIERMLLRPVNLTSQEMLNEAQAFDQFRKSYRKHQAMQKNAAILQQKMIKGKQVGKAMNDIRDEIQRLKSRLQSLKRQNAVNSLVQGKQIEDPQEQEIRNRINELKEKSKPLVNELRSAKADIDSLNVLQKKLKEQLQNDFHRWMLHVNGQRQKMIKGVDASLMASNVKDKEVSKHLQSFFKAREEILKR